VRLPLRLTLLAFATVVLQQAAVSQITLFGVSADLTPLVVMSVGLLAGSLAGAVMGFGMGLLVDMVLVHTLGHVEGGPQAVNYLLARCVDVGPEKFMKDRLKGNPVSCPSIRKKIGHVTRRVPCNCPFDFAPDRYPTPVLHLLTLPPSEAAAPAAPAAADVETLARRYSALRQRRQEIDELSKLVVAPPTALFDTEMRIDLGHREVILHNWGRANSPADVTAYVPGERILFTGDIQDDAMGPLLKNPERLRADVLVAPHHGSSEPLTARFIEAIHPSTILSSNDRSRWDTVRALVDDFMPGQQVTVRATTGDAPVKEFQALVRIDTPQEALYYANGGILQYVLRQLLAGKTKTEAGTA